MAIDRIFKMRKTMKEIEVAEIIGKMTELDEETRCRLATFVN